MSEKVKQIEESVEELINIDTDDNGDGEANLLNIYDDMKWLVEQVKQLESENEQLRESLEEIRRIVDVTPYREYTTNKIRYRLFNLAKQALRGDNN